MIQNPNMKLFQNKIRSILLKEWDPIGIQDIPEADDEYDSYVDPVYNLLVSEATENEIFNYLWWLETEHMGLNGDMQKTKAIAKKFSVLLTTTGLMDELVAENNEKELSKPIPEITEVAKDIYENWLMCPLCFEAWESQSKYAMVRCPKCDEILHNPKYRS